jgi:hypothetical protein
MTQTSNSYSLAKKKIGIRLLAELEYYICFQLSSASNNYALVCVCNHLIFANYKKAY